MRPPRPLTVGFDKMKIDHENEEELCTMALGIWLENISNVKLINAYIYIVDRLYSRLIKKIIIIIEYCKVGTNISFCLLFSCFTRLVEEFWFWPFIMFLLLQN